MQGVKTKGKGAVRYLLIRPRSDGDPQNGLGVVLSRHSKLRPAKNALSNEQLECELQGIPCASYLWDRKTKAPVS